MQNAKLANSLGFAANAKIDGRSVAREESVLVELLDPVTVWALALKALFVGGQGSSEHQQHSIQQTVDDLETTVLAAPCCTKVTLVASLALNGVILESHVGGFEDLHGQTVALVLSDGLEKTGDERGSDNLVLLGLGVGKTDSSLSVILAVEPSKVLIVTAEDEREDFAPASHGGFDTENVTQLIDSQRRANGGAAAGCSARKLVEAVADCEIFHHITLVKDVWAGDGDSSLQDVLVC